MLKPPKQDEPYKYSKNLYMREEIENNSIESTQLFGLCV